MAQLFEALRYKPEGRGFDPRWYHWNFSLTIPSDRTMTLWSIQLLTKNEYQEYFLVAQGGWCVGLS
jgi:hypothetical protein